MVFDPQQEGLVDEAATSKPAMKTTDLYEIERSLWTNDPKVYRASLRDDALLMFQETGVITRDNAIAAIQQENRENRRWTEVAFSDQRVFSPTDDTRFLIYKATARWNYEQDPRTVLCSSLYTSQSGEWKLVFHQQTPVA
jgi:hypothetical protein